MLNNTNVPDDSILDRIRKLHALATNAGTEAEAANAAGRVADLCRKYNLELGSVVIQQREKKASRGRSNGNGGIWEAHRGALMAAVEALFDVGSYRESVPRIDPRYEQGWRVVFYGLKANVESATLTYNYLDESVEAMLQGAVKTRKIAGRAQTRSFRMGCANRVWQEAVNVSRLQRNAIDGSTEQQAIVLVGNQLKEAFRAEMKLKPGKRQAGPKDDYAYGQGYAAGARVDLHGARSNRMLKG